MKVFAAAVRNNGGDDYVFVSRTEDGLTEQIIETGRHEYGPASENEHYLDNSDEYLGYDHYLLEQYYIMTEGEFDL